MAPAPRASVGEASVECLQTLIHVFRLLVHLGMIRCAHPQLRASVFEEFLPEMTCEDRILIGDNGVREAMQG